MHICYALHDVIEAHCYGAYKTELLIHGRTLSSLIDVHSKMFRSQSSSSVTKHTKQASVNLPTCALVNQ